jgi:hypothetical protein
MKQKKAPRCGAFFWMQVYRQLAVGSWQLAVGSWQLAVNNFRV